MIKLLRLIGIIIFFVIPVAAQTRLPMVGGTVQDFDGSPVGRVYSSVSSCTGTLVSPSLVLTAAHCMFDREGQAVDSHSVVVQFGGLYHRGQQVYAHPDYDPIISTYLQAHADLAIIKLAYPSALTPAPVGMSGMRQVGESLTVMGFGMNEAGDPHGRVGIVRVNSLKAGVFESVGTTMVCGGDSGGPVMRDDAIVGVSSYATWAQNPDGTCRAVGTGLSGFVDLTSPLSVEFLQGFNLEERYEPLYTLLPTTPKVRRKGKRLIVVVPQVDLEDKWIEVAVGGRIVEASSSVVRIRVRTKRAVLVKYRIVSSSEASQWSPIVRK
jgi:hypothetical protein